MNLRSKQLIICLFFGISAFAQRSSIDMNEDWKFELSDEAAFCSVDFDDKDWRSVTLPHDWSVESDFSKDHSGRNAFLPGGIGWYRKTFVVPEEMEGQSVQIQFDGVYKNARVWVNEHPVGVQHDGYTSFYFDISELVSFGAENTVAVRVDNSIQPNCRWYSGSGIYRNVWLNVSNQTHVATWGTYITTPIISRESAEVNITTTIENISDNKDLAITTVIFDPKGGEVASTTSPLSVGRYSITELKQVLNVTQPQLWSLDNTQQYLALTSIKSGGVVIDEYFSSFGIRTIVFDAEKGFFLNGKNLKMKGVCLHHDAGPLGAAVPKEVWRKRLEQLQEIGCNAIRTSHNPASPEFLDLCDELGMLVMDEFVDKWENAYKKPKAKKNPFFDAPMAEANFASEWKANFGTTVKRDRNHPSVIIWSVGNENHSPGTAAQNHGLRNYGSFVRSLDPTRPVISGMERGRDEAVDDKVNHIIESCQFMDLIALNYGEQWCKLIADKQPGKPYVSTESYVYFNSALEKRFANIERSPWLDVMENDNNMGLFLWVGFDYLGESKKWPKLGSNSGLFDYAGFRKSISYLYESFWSDKPMVHIEVYESDADDFSTSGRWSYPPVNAHWNLPEDSVVDITCYSNCETVDLYLNNKLIGTQTMADFPNWIMKWRKIAYQSGTLKAVGKIDGKAVCEMALVTADAPAKIKMSSNKSLVSDGDMVHVELQLIDKKGRPVIFEEKQLQFSLIGEGEIITLANGNISTAEPFYIKDTRSTYKGHCLCLVKPSKRSLVLEVSGEGLKTARYIIQD